MALYVNHVTVVSEPGLVPVPEVQGREDAMGWQLTVEAWVKTPEARTAATSWALCLRDHIAMNNVDRPADRKGQISSSAPGSSRSSAAPATRWSRSCPAAGRPRA